MTTQIPDTSISDLRDAIAGRVVSAADPDYDQARAVTLGDVDNRPAAIIKVANAADVVHATSLARATDAELAVRSGGHSGAGHSATWDRLRDVKRRYDPDNLFRRNQNVPPAEG